MLVQLFLWYNIAALYPTVSLSLPGIGEFFSASSNALISPFSAAVIALVMHQSAYAAEIIRAGIQSVGNGQLEAARALGYTRSQIFRHTVLPQAMRAILPPAGNEVIGQLKTTAVVSVISLQDVLYSAQIIYQRTYEVIPLLLVATLWYLLLTSVLSVGQFYVERYFARGVKRETAKVWFARKLPVFLFNARALAMAETIELRNITKRFGGQTVVDAVDLDVDAGSVTVILGPSGSGKSTLLRCINHLEKAGCGHHSHRWQPGRLCAKRPGAV
jgi:polar amino acid transport system permease protein